MSSARRIVAYVPDLMDQSRVRGGVPGGTEVVFVRRAEQLLDPPIGKGEPTEVVIVIDLDRPDSGAVLELLDGRVLGFASHVNTETLTGAPGFIEVMPRSVFFRRLADL